MLLIRGKAANELCDYFGEQPALPSISVVDEIVELHCLQTDETTQCSKDVVSYLNPAAYLKALDVAHLFDRAVVLLNLPVLVVQPLEVSTCEGRMVIGFWEGDNVMPQLVFQARAIQFDLPKVA